MQVFAKKWLFVASANDVCNQQQEPGFGMSVNLTSHVLKVKCPYTGYHGWHEKTISLPNYGSSCNPVKAKISVTWR